MPASLSNIARIGFSLSLAAALGACGSMDFSPTRISEVVKPYRIDVIQGNVITSEQVQALKSGMDRQAVRDLLGTPLMLNVFHANRWDYVFTLRRQGEEPQSRRVTVFFKDELLERFEADSLPTEAEFVASMIGRVHSGKVPALEATEETLKAFPAPARTAATQPRSNATTLPATYPPLEPSSP
jgi:outer membrane protein assembly factor BamE